MTTEQILLFGILLVIVLILSAFALYREYMILKWIHKIQAHAKGYGCVNIHKNIVTKRYTVHMITFMGRDRVMVIDNQFVGMLIYRQIPSKEFDNQLNEKIKSLGESAYLLDDVI